MIVTEENRKKRESKFIKQLVEKTKSIILIGKFVSTDKKTTFKCLKGEDHIFESTPSNVLKHYCCPFCFEKEKKEKSKKSFFDRCEEQGIFERVEIVGKYENMNTPIECKCKIHNHTWFPKPPWLLRAGQCPICSYENTGKLNSKSNKDFLQECKEEGILDIVNILDPYINNNTPVRLQCIKHPDQIWTKLPVNIVRGGNLCPICAQEWALQKFGLTLEEVNQRLLEQGKDIEMLSPYLGAQKESTFICHSCGKTFKTTPSNLLYNNSSCPFCGGGLSFPNKLIRYLLTDLQAENFRYEFRDSWTKYYRYDAYFTQEKDKWLVEMDGGYHTKDICGNLEKQQKADKEKDELAKTNNFNLIRIDCSMWKHELIVQEIKNSKLGKLFDLESFNWSACLEKAEANIVKQVCDYFNTNKGQNGTTLSKVFPISNCTAINYLKIGNEFGWCNYDPTQSCRKRVNVYDLDMNLLNSFKSIFDCVRYYENEGIKLVSNYISKTCKHCKPSYKGFIFRYADEDENEDKNN